MSSLGLWRVDTGSDLQQLLSFPSGYTAVTDRTFMAPIPNSDNFIIGILGKNTPGPLANIRLKVQPWVVTRPGGLLYMNGSSVVSDPIAATDLFFTSVEWVETRVDRFVRILLAVYGVGVLQYRYDPISNQIEPDPDYPTILPWSEGQSTDITIDGIGYQLFNGNLVGLPLQGRNNGQVGFGYACHSVRVYDPPLQYDGQVASGTGVVALRQLGADPEYRVLLDTEVSPFGGTMPMAVPGCDTDIFLPRYKAPMQYVRFASDGTSTVYTGPYEILHDQTYAVAGTDTLARFDGLLQTGNRPYEYAAGSVAGDGSFVMHEGQGAWDWDKPDEWNNAYWPNWHPRDGRLVVVTDSSGPVVVQEWNPSVDLSQQVLASTSILTDSIGFGNKSVRVTTLPGNTDIAGAGIDEWVIVYGYDDTNDQLFLAQIQRTATTSGVWVFGDGQTSASMVDHIDHTYAEAGTYLALNIVYNDDGTQAWGAIDVNVSPSQTITFPQPADIALNAGPVTLTATASSGLQVSYTSETPSVCTVAGSSVTLVSVGTCTIDADQAGNGSWAAAPQVVRSFAIRETVFTVTAVPDHGYVPLRTVITAADVPGGGIS